VEDGPQVKAGAGAPILARRERLGQLPDRARHRRSIKTFRENQTNIQKRNRKGKGKGKEVPYWPGTNQQESN